MPTIREVLEALRSLDVKELQSQLVRVRDRIRELQVEKHQLEQMIEILVPTSPVSTVFRESPPYDIVPPLRPGERFEIRNTDTPAEPEMSVSRQFPPVVVPPPAPHEELSLPAARTAPPVGPEPRRSSPQAVPSLPAHLAPSAAERAVHAQSSRNRDSRTEVLPEPPVHTPPAEPNYGRHGNVEKLSTQEAITGYLQASGPTKVKTMSEQLGRDYAQIYTYCNAHPELYIKTGPAEYALKARH